MLDHFPITLSLGVHAIYTGSVGSTYAFYSLATDNVGLEQDAGTTDAAAVPLGDLSCDDVVNTTDALFILQFNVGLRTDTPDCPLPNPSTNLYASACDVSEDSNCNTTDALYILQCNVGLNNPFCPAE